MVLRACWAMCGTEIAYDAPRTFGFGAGTLRTPASSYHPPPYPPTRLLCQVRYWPSDVQY
eukprot:3634015-Rhodomonas_salina.1